MQPYRITTCRNIVGIPPYAMRTLTEILIDKRGYFMAGKVINGNSYMIRMRKKN